VGFFFRPVDGEVRLRTGMPGHFNVANALGAFAATLALGTGLGGSHPPVQVTADTLSTRLPCLLVTLGDHPGAPLRELLGITTAETATGVPA
jgi:hypothetical protein